MRILPVVLIFYSLAFGQVKPSHVLATEDLSDPTHPKALVIFPSTGADQYRVYEGMATGANFGCVPVGSMLTQTQIWPDGSIHRAGTSAYVFETTLPGSIPTGYSVSYSDDPNPELSAIPATSQLGGRGWCYSVSSVLAGNESALSTPQPIWMGLSAYYAWSYYTSCGGTRLPYPFPASAYHPKLWYRDPNGINHQFSYVDNTVFVDNGGKGQDEIEFHLPVIADDGTMIPLLDASNNGQALYYVELNTPDGYEGVANILPFRQGDHVYYNDIQTGFVLGDKNYAHDCHDSGSWWEDVSY